MPMGLSDGVLLSIQICSIGQWGTILVMVMGFVGTFKQCILRQQRTGYVPVLLTFITVLILIQHLKWVGGRVKKSPKLCGGNIWVDGS